MSLMSNSLEIKTQVDRMKTKLELPPETPLSVVADNVSKGGGTVETNVYRVKTLAERDAITTAKEGDMCVVHDEKYTALTPTSTVGGLAVPKEITITQDAADFNLEFRPSDGWEPNIRIDKYGSDFNVMIQAGSMGGYFRYTSTDGRTFSLDEHGLQAWERQHTFIFSTTITGMAYEPITSAGSLELIGACSGYSISFEGLFSFKNNTWNFTAINCSIDPKTMSYANKVYTDSGIITGELGIATGPAAYNARQYKVPDAGPRLNAGVEDMSYLYSYVEQLGVPNIPTCAIKDLDTSAATNMSHMFYYSKLPLTDADVVNFNTSKVTNMASMFAVCTNVVSLNLSSFDTSNVTDMSCMFDSCNKTTSLDLSSFNTSNVTDINHMFHNCSKLKTINLSNFNTSKITSLNNLFGGCWELDSLDLSNFDTSNVTDMSGLFTDCRRIRSINVSSFNTSKVTDMDFMFHSNFYIEYLNLSNFDTSSVNRMNGMFYGCGQLRTLDLSNFNTSNVVTMNTVFKECYSLQNLDISGFTFDNVSSTWDMFQGVPSNCKILVKSQKEKDFVLAQRSDLTNVQVKAS